MRTARITILALAVVMILGVGTSNAFHDGGVAECIGCHSMHDPQSNNALLQASDATSTCLDCHEGSPGSYHISTPEGDMPAGTPPAQRTAGGDFGWLKKTFTWSPPWGGNFTEEGYTHGHNIVAADYNYVVDPINTTAPGGSGYPSAQLGCNSCHDPHGQYRRTDTGAIVLTGVPIVDSGSYNNSADPTANEAVGVYRLLAGAGYVSDGVTFGNTPAIVSPATYNRPETDSQTRVAYGDGIGDWCKTCHPDMHSNTPGTYTHPVDFNLFGDATIYNQYRGSGNMTGTIADSYLSLVPFEENIGASHSIADYTTLKGLAQIDDSELGGPGATDQVTCVSCHRAHASGWEYAMRWNPESEFIVVESVWPGTDNPIFNFMPQFPRGRSTAEYAGGMNDYLPTTFASYQRSLCNKCHAKD